MATRIVLSATGGAEVMQLEHLQAQQPGQQCMLSLRNTIA